MTNVFDIEFFLSQQMMFIRFKPNFIWLSWTVQSLNQDQQLRSDIFKQTNHRGREMMMKWPFVFLPLACWWKLTGVGGSWGRWQAWGCCLFNCCLLNFTTVQCSCFVLLRPCPSLTHLCASLGGRRSTRSPRAKRISCFTGKVNSWLPLRLQFSWCYYFSHFGSVSLPLISAMMRVYYGYCRKCNVGWWEGILVLISWIHNSKFRIRMFFSGSVQTACSHPGPSLS